MTYLLSHSNLFRFANARANQWSKRYYSPVRQDAEQISDAFLSWLDADTRRPFFAFLNDPDAHDPYAPHAPFDRRFATHEPPTRWVRPGRHTVVEINGLRDAYDGAIAYLDAEIGRLFAELEDRGRLAETILIITSDHGEEFGEHTVLGHGNSLYLPALHVPLLMVFPGRLPARVRISEAVTLRDLPATVLDLVGGSGAQTPGTSLRRTWESAASIPGSGSPLLAQVPFARNLPSWYPVSAGDLKSLIVPPYHYIRNAANDELYDIRRDPWEERNLAGSVASQPVLSELRRQLDSLSSAVGHE